MLFINYKLTTLKIPLVADMNFTSLSVPSVPLSEAQFTAKSLTSLAPITKSYIDIHSSANVTVPPVIGSK